MLETGIYKKEEKKSKIRKCLGRQIAEQSKGYKEGQDEVGVDYHYYVQHVGRIYEFQSVEGLNGKELEQEKPAHIYMQ